jgi:hypothetical protein
MTMDPNAVRGLINQLLFAIQFAPDLSDNTSVEYVAESIRTQRNFRHSPAEYAEAIATVLDDGYLPRQGWLVPDLPHSEDEVLKWLGCVAQRLSPGSENAPTTRGG